MQRVTSMAGAQSEAVEVIAVNEAVLAAALVRDPNLRPQMELKLPDGAEVAGRVVFQVLTVEGPLLLSASVLPGGRSDRARFELAPVDESVRRWLEAQVQ